MCLEMMYIALVLPSQISLLYQPVTVEYIRKKEIQFIGKLDLHLANFPKASLRKLF